MGQHADDIVNGDVCEICGEWLGDGEGFPQRCSSHAAQDKMPRRNKRHPYKSKLKKKFQTETERYYAREVLPLLTLKNHEQEFRLRKK